MVVYLFLCDFVMKWVWDTDFRCIFNHGWSHGMGRKKEKIIDG